MTNLSIFTMDFKLRTSSRKKKIDLPKRRLLWKIFITDNILKTWDNEFLVQYNSLSNPDF